MQLPVRYRVVGNTFVDPARDLSMGGMFLSCLSPLPLGTRLEVLLGPSDEAEPLRLEATVVRVVWGGRRDGRPIEPGMALAFVTLSSIEEQRLSKLLEAV